MPDYGYMSAPIESATARSEGLFLAAKQLAELGRFRSALALLRLGDLRPETLTILADIYRQSMAEGDPVFAQDARDLINANFPEYLRRKALNSVDGFRTPEINQE